MVSMGEALLPEGDSHGDSQTHLPPSQSITNDNPSIHPLPDLDAPRPDLLHEGLQSSSRPATEEIEHCEGEGVHGEPLLASMPAGGEGASMRPEESGGKKQQPCPSPAVGTGPAMLLPEIASELQGQEAFKSQQEDGGGFKVHPTRSDPLVLDMIQRQGSKKATQAHQARDIFLTDSILSGEVKRKDLQSAGVAGQDLPSGSNVTTKRFQTQPHQEKRKATRAEKGKTIELPSPPPVRAQRLQPQFTQANSTEQLGEMETFSAW